MQIANGIVVVNKDHEQPKYDVTPAEAIVLHKLHLSGSKGIPLKDFVIIEGEAVTVIGKKKATVKRKNVEGVDVDAEIDVPITRPRTAQEELTRLRKAYPGTVKGEDGKSAPVVNVCFPGHIKHLPETFEELEGNLTGIIPGFFKRGNKPSAAGNPELEAKRDELMERKRDELITLAEGMKLTVEPGEKKSAIVEKILAAAEATPTAAV